MVELEKEVFTVECKSQNIFGPHCMQGFPFQTAFVLLTTSWLLISTETQILFFFFQIPNVPFFGKALMRFHQAMCVIPVCGGKVGMTHTFPQARGNDDSPPK